MCANVNSRILLLAILMFPKLQNSLLYIDKIDKKVTYAHIQIDILHYISYNFTIKGANAHFDSCAHTAGSFCTMYLLEEGR